MRPRHISRGNSEITYYEQMNKFGFNEAAAYQPRKQVQAEIDNAVGKVLQ